MMIEVIVTGSGLLVHDAEFLLIRPCDAIAEVEVAIGTALCAAQTLIASECHDWFGGASACFASTIEVHLTPGQCYDVVAWTEADDRSQPHRMIDVVGDGWTFTPSGPQPQPHPGDETFGPAQLALMLGSWGACLQGTTCESDYSGDGTVGPADLAFLLGSWGTQTPNPLTADLDGDGGIGPMDLAILMDSWGPFAPAGTAPDFTADGIVGPQDLVILLLEWGESN